MLDLLNAVSVIATLFLLGSGLGIVFSVMGVINFAHGEFMMAGAYVTVLFAGVGGGWLGILAAPIVVGLGGLLIEAGVIRRLYQRPLDTILATFGISIVLQELIQVIFGPEFKSVKPPVSGSTEVLGTAYPTYRLLLVAIAVLIAVALWIATQTGGRAQRLRAVIANPELASGIGINVPSTYRMGFFIGSALAGLGGSLLAPLVAVSPRMGTAFLVESFMTAIVGGPTNIVGGLAAGAGFLGTTSSLVTRFGSSVAGTIALVLVSLLVMRLLPGGLSSARIRRPRSRNSL